MRQRVCIYRDSFLLSSFIHQEYFRDGQIMIHEGAIRRIIVKVIVSHLYFDMSELFSPGEKFLLESYFQCLSYLNKYYCFCCFSLSNFLSKLQMLVWQKENVM